MVTGRIMAFKEIVARSFTFSNVNYIKRMQHTFLKNINFVEISLKGICPGHVISH